MTSGLTYVRRTSSADAIKQLGSTLAPYLHAGDMIVLTGDLGAGKTQFVQGVAAALGIKAPITSPTFNIVISYAGGRLPLYHLDLYRIENAKDLEDIDYYSLIDSDNNDGVVFVEWGEKFSESLPCDYLRISIDVLESGQRSIRVHSYGSQARQLLYVWANDSKSRLSETTESTRA